MPRIITYTCLGCRATIDNPARNDPANWRYDPTTGETMVDIESFEFRCAQCNGGQAEFFYHPEEQQLMSQGAIPAPDGPHGANAHQRQAGALRPERHHSRRNRAPEGHHGHHRAHGQGQAPGFQARLQAMVPPGMLPQGLAPQGRPHHGEPHRGHGHRHGHGHHHHHHEDDEYDDSEEDDDYYGSDDEHEPDCMNHPNNRHRQPNLNHGQMRQAGPPGGHGRVPNANPMQNLGRRLGQGPPGGYGQPGAYGMPAQAPPAGMGRPVPQGARPQARPDVQRMLDTYTGRAQGPPGSVELPPPGMYTIRADGRIIDDEGYPMPAGFNPPPGMVAQPGAASQGQGRAQAPPAYNPDPYGYDY
ncbi:hypothetical protein NW752_009077 [Fusarium irregulare]|uniref:Uncharacterized protein n=1 Tax=Fusarium irregulare TaxID=2494466 RepID=A0A9W8PJQ5_9HYPO|nr:hypothetical protein NW766_008604 [Fusarium irregulare]KAJ4009903.1 hypothetical protein NW752_009077 [Fusarium irregulare]